MSSSLGILLIFIWGVVSTVPNLASGLFQLGVSLTPYLVHSLKPDWLTQNQTPPMPSGMGKKAIPLKKERVNRLAAND
eukprot:scaffold5115_cov113-Isochrysis_galbana.AAC.3